MKAPLWLVLAVCCVLTSSASAVTYVVRPDGTGDFPNINAAVDGAVDGDVIELTDGTFTGSMNCRIDYNDKAITIRSQSGNPETCIIDCEGIESNPQWGIRFVNGEGPSSILEGVTITNGWLGDSGSGGALQCRTFSNPTITNCIFMNSHAGGSGGVWIQNSNPTVTGCIFVGNTAIRDGGGLHCNDASPIITDCLFLGNSAGESGGAVEGNFTAAPVFTNCIFAGNSAPVGAAIRFDADSAPTFNHCTIQGNTAPGGDSIIFARDNAALVFVSSIVASNAEGASVRCADAATITLTCSNVYGNAGGDWVDCIASQANLLGNFSADPGFCSTTPEVDHYWALQSNSPCAPGNHPNGDDCGTIGAWEVQCGTSAVERRTWGSIKGAYR